MMRPAFLFTLLCVLATNIADAHPAHDSAAEAEFNDQTQRLEVALRVHAADLEQALRGAVDQPVDLERSADIEQLISDYVAKRFVIESADGTTARLQWIGKELDKADCWLYFEFSLGDGIRGTTIENRLLFELFPDQLNLLTIRLGDNRRTIWFDRDHSRRELNSSRREPRVIPRTTQSNAPEATVSE